MNKSTKIKPETIHKLKTLIRAMNSDVIDHRHDLKFEHMYLNS